MTYDEARMEYETDPTCTFQRLADEMGVTHQAVSKKARKDGWVKADKGSLEVAKQFEVSKPTAGSKLGIRSEENIAKVLNVYALTGNQTIAAKVIGVDPTTLQRWAKSEPELAVAMRAKRYEHLVEQYQKIASSKDWKAAKELLAHAPETKDEWSDKTQGNTTFVLNIQRD